MLCTHIILSLHWQFVDKDNYLNKLSQTQIQREKNEYMTSYLLHMYVQVALQLIFPTMFFSDASVIPECAKEVFWMHVFFVEPLYYFVHRWLHVKGVMKKMHAFHHLSIKTLPTTSLVQNFHEHFVYIATYAPVFMVPFLVYGRQHWAVVGGYIVIFDIVNAWGHTNVKLRSSLFTSVLSPLKYLFYTPEFHLGHHAYFNANYALFVPFWDYLFGTYREYMKNDVEMLPKKQQDFVFIGHNGGLGHLFTIPELCFYNVYDEYKRTFLPRKLEFLTTHIICLFTRFFFNFYYCSCFCVANKYIGRIIVLLRTPWDYMSPKSYDAINRDMLKLIRQEYDRHGTRYFGLGNLNKMNQLNDGGVEIVRLVESDPYLKDKKIRIWTGDTMTVASVFNQIADIPNLDKLYYVGAGGKIGTAVCKMLVQERPNLKIRIFSRNQVLQHQNISYSTDLSEIADYTVALVGKILSGEMYKKALDRVSECKTRFVLDYTVPAFPIAALKKRGIHHIRIGMLQTHHNNPFLKGHYDLCMGHDENIIVSCHFGCLLNTTDGRETHEVGEIDQKQVMRLWKMTTARGFHNIAIDYSQ